MPAATGGRIAHLADMYVDQATLAGHRLVAPSGHRQPWSWALGIASQSACVVWELVTLLAGGYTMHMVGFVRLGCELLAIELLLRPSSRAALGAGG